MIRVLLADDHQAMRAGVRLILEGEPDLEVVGEASTGEETRRLCVDLTPDVVLLDISMPGPPTVETIDWLRTNCTSTRIVIYSVHDEGPVVRRLLGAGASGYVVKSEEAGLISTAIRTVVTGVTSLSQRARTALEADDTATALGLGERDWRILRMLAAGLDAGQIAEELGIQTQSVHNYLYDMHKKLGVTSSLAAVAWYHEHCSGVL